MAAYLPLFYDQQFLADSGSLGSLYYLYTYDSGTTTPKATYTDATGVTPNSNPITLNSAGRAASAIFLGSGAYSFELKTDAGVLVKRWDGIESGNSAALAFAADLANAASLTKGDYLVAVQRTSTSTAATTVHDWIEKKPLCLKADFGAVADGLTDQRSIIMTAMSVAAAAGRQLDVEAGTYAVAGHLPLTSGLRMRWLPGARFKLTSATAVGGFITGQYSGSTPVAISDVRLTNPVIDCNSQAGENGFGISTVQDIRIINPEVYNCLHDPVTFGGRAFQFEGGDIVGVHVVSPHVENCTIGINSQADSAAGTKKARFIAYYNVTMKNVDVPFNVDSQFANPQNGISENMSTHVVGAALFNCGKLTYSGAVATGGGIICGDRGYGLRVSGLRVVNETSYGTIGALLRGRVYGIQLDNVVVDVPAMTAVFDFNEVGFGSPGTGAASTTAFATNVTVKANLDYIVKGSTGGIGAASLQCTVAGATASLTGIVDTNGASTSALCQFVNSDDGVSTGLMSLKDMSDAGNAFSFFSLQRTGFARVQYVRSATDEVSTGLFKLAAPNHSRVSIAYQICVMYPQSTNDAAVTTQSGVASAVLDGSGNFSRTVTATSSATVLDTVASLTATVDLLYASNEIFFAVTQNNETVDAACDIYVAAQVIYSLGGTKSQPKITLL